MNSHHQEHLRSLDAAIIAMVDERARLIASAEQPLACALDDLMSRYQGPLSPSTLRELVAALERASNSVEPT
jgi:hypothetical protein